MTFDRYKVANARKYLQFDLKKTKEINFCKVYAWKTKLTELVIFLGIFRHGMLKGSLQQTFLYLWKIIKAPYKNNAWFFLKKTFPFHFCFQDWQIRRKKFRAEISFQTVFNQIVGVIFNISLYLPNLQAVNKK